ncbi:MAG TPA: hypothetical protein PLP18_06865 [Smithellaceae bacterium]|nr:hypothetical protein [Smithellaceae bacterium]
MHPSKQHWQPQRVSAREAAMAGGDPSLPVILKYFSAVFFMGEIWATAAAVNVKSVLPMIETPIDKINIKAMARRIERKYQTPAKWNCTVNERCDPGIKAILMLP